MLLDEKNENQNKIMLSSVKSHYILWLLICRKMCCYGKMCSSGKMYSYDKMCSSGKMCSYDKTWSSCRIQFILKFLQICQKSPNQVAIILCNAMM